MPSIRFEPTGISVEFADGQEVNLLRVSIRHGGGIPYKCASGKCGTDRVRIQHGGSNLSPVRPRERERLGADVDRGFRLACQTYVRGDVVVTWDVSSTVEASERVKERWLSQADGA